MLINEVLLTEMPARLPAAADGRNEYTGEPMPQEDVVTEISKEDRISVSDLRSAEQLGAVNSDALPAGQVNYYYFKNLEQPTVMALMRGDHLREFLKTSYPDPAFRDYLDNLRDSETGYELPLDRYYFPLMRLRFKNPAKETYHLLYPKLKNKKIWQADTVTVFRPLRGINLATGCYQLLVTRGVILCSDNWQSGAGAKIWKSLIKITEARFDPNNSTNAEYAVFLLTRLGWLSRDVNEQPKPVGYSKKYSTLSVNGEIIWNLHLGFSLNNLLFYGKTSELFNYIKSSIASGVPKISYSDLKIAAKDYADKAKLDPQINSRIYNNQNLAFKDQSQSTKDVSQLRAKLISDGLAGLKALKDSYQAARDFTSVNDLTKKIQELQQQIEDQWGTEQELVAQAVSTGEFDKYLR